MRVKLSELRDAYDFVSASPHDEHEAFVSRVSGKIYWRAAMLEDDDELPDDIDESDRYIAIPGKRDLGLGKRLALDFADEVLPGDSDKVRQIFSRKGAYARFKDLLEHRGALQQWYDYEAKAEDRALRDWCEENDIELEDEGATTATHLVVSGVAPLNVCMVGYGMMGQWHSEALTKLGVPLHTIVGRRPDATKEFAERHGYAKWTTSLDEALADPAIDIVILGTPSEQHEEQAIKSLEAGKHTLIEIPIAMSLTGAERVVAAGERSGKIYGLSHPMRFRREREALRARIRAGEERIRHIAGRFFIKRLVNIGATGYQRSWTDNILWHHFCHFVDLGMFLLEGAQVRSVQSYLGALHPKTGIPMECIVTVETDADQTLMVHGSYHATYRFYDKLIVTDRDTYFYDILAGTLRTAEGTQAIEPEQQNAARIIDDFIDAVRSNRPPLASGPSALPAMRILQAAQDAWDARHGAQSIPGRPL